LDHPFLQDVLENEDSEWGAQVLGRSKEAMDASEIAARDEFNRKNPQARGLVVPGNLKTMKLPFRPWRNNRGLFFKLAGNRNIQAHVSEIPPGGNTTRHRHTTEAYIYIVRGHGYSIINYEGEPEQRMDWEEGSLFSPPVWAWHQHFNPDPDEPARYLAVQDTGIKRHLRLHRIERHPSQLRQGEELDYAVKATPASEN
jgi:quercetin dioxygenase-like cupin family protein